MQPKAEVKPDWRVVRIEQIGMCNKSWVAEKRLVSCGIYAITDANLHVHICSLTPNLEVWPVQGYAEFADEQAWEKDEGEAEQEMLGTEDLVGYYDTDLLRQHPHRPLSQFITIPEPEEDEDEEHYRERVAEAAREYFAGNPTAFSASEGP
jgi:hypothetical protein